MPYYKQPLLRLCTLENIYSVRTQSEEVPFIQGLCHSQADWAQPFSSVSSTCCVDPIHHAIVLSWSELVTTQSYHCPPSPDKDSPCTQTLLCILKLCAAASFASEILHQTSFRQNIPRKGLLQYACSQIFHLCRTCYKEHSFHHFYWWKHFTERTPLPSCKK